MKILITGGLGYVGSFLTALLLKDQTSSYQIYIVDNLSNVRASESDPRVHLTHLDLSDPVQTLKYFQQHTFDLVIHLAAKIYVHDSFLTPELYQLHNFVATQNILAMCEKFKIEKFIFASSSTLYKSPVGLDRLIENSQLGPLNPYGQTKLDCELLILNSKTKLCGYIFRFFNIAGADPLGRRGQNSIRPKHVIDKLSDQISSGQSQVNISGQYLKTPDGTIVRDFIHVQDVAQLLVKAVKKIKSENNVQIFNCGSGKGTSLLELVSVFRRVTKKQIQIQWTEYHQGDPLFLVSESQKAQNYFHWKPEHSEITQIVESAFRWTSLRKKYGMNSLLN